VTMRALLLAAALTAAGASAAGFRDCPDCAEMVDIPAGRFTMGSSASEAVATGVPEGHAAYEHPQHEVTVGRFAIGKYDVTRGEFASFVAATGYRTPGCEPEHVLAPPYAQTDNYPATCVNWSDAQAYISWLSAKTGKSYRLPTEAEWEYAARAGTTTPWFWGNDAARECGFANGGDLSMKDGMPDHSGTDLCRDGYAFASPVGSFRPNGWGLYDMAGNVWQWVADCWHETYDGAPSDGSAWTIDACDKRDLRGGAWNMNAYHVRSANRNFLDPAIRSDRIGFRLARTLP
jgi:sulfatase modifying factor 1